MKLKKLVLIIIILLLAPLYLTSNAKHKDADKNNIRLLFTNDLHSHILPYTDINNNTMENYSGFAGISNIIENERKNHNTLTIDGGDFIAGSMFNTITTTQAPELTLMDKMGFDVTTLGNHEFDFGMQQLTKMINIARKKNINIPILASSINFNYNNESKKLKKALKESQEKSVPETFVINKGGIKIGLFGLLGKNAVSDINNSNNQLFNNYIDSAKQSVNILKKQNVDMIIALSHSGTVTANPMSKKSEDVILAKQVPDIDFILSGHTHTYIEKPFKVGKTIIWGLDAYARNLGEIDINLQNGVPEISHYKLFNNNNINNLENKISNEIDAYIPDIYKYTYNNYGIKVNKTIINNPWNLEAGFDNTNPTLAKLITDSAIWTVENKGYFKDKTKFEIIDNIKPISMTFDGVIRGSLLKGNLNFNQIFSVLPNGTGPDNLAGYPLINVFLSGGDLLNIAEINESIAPILPDFKPAFSNFKYKYNKFRLPMNKVISGQVKKTNGKWIKIDKNKKYSLLVDYYAGSQIENVKKMSYGAIDFKTYNKNGDQITNLDDLILYSKNGKEIKDWESLYRYLDYLGKNNNNSIPKSYENVKSFSENTITNLKTLTENPNKFTFLICLVLLSIPLLILIINCLIVGLVFLIYYLIHRNKKN